MAESFSYKITTEVKSLSFDFSQVLASGETLSTSTCTVIVVDGTDATPSNLLSDRKSTRLNSSHSQQSRMPSSA